jgi:hypothetical protein
MFSNEMTMRVMANKYRRLAEQTELKKRDKYVAYARIYSELARHSQRIRRGHPDNGRALGRREILPIP